ncbi:MAG: Microcin C7 self-immunity protein mccF [uncultured Truepera sp.]|uniref:Microcin C7 self-immunity protein mccF n=1 Tax=uncultured Truepera sp. TaxID=543023 RepID=A0A6J4UMC9_9DEIN|nr:MAG: Microcin C7 self-immunity protein mccF [uncultured Truepera sp.]
MTFIKPPKLQAGDTVAAISLSSGAAGEFPQVYRVAKQNVEQTLGVRLIETPNALRDNGWLYRNPEARADDLHWALQNPEVKGMVSTIGGCESVRVLPFVNPELIRANPKVLLGYSDTTVTQLAFLNAGVVSLYGPSLMSGFADLEAFPYAETWAKRLLGGWHGPYEASETWTEDLSDWNATDFEAEVARSKTLHPGGWRWLQGEMRADGHVIGGCIEVLEMLKGTRFWPSSELWRGAVLFFETSEDRPSPDQVEYWLRNYATQGILGEAAALLIARPRGYTPEQKEALRCVVKKVLLEVDRADMPVVTDVDIGHTSPMMTLPLGCRVAVDAEKRTVELLEPAVS